LFSAARNEDELMTSRLLSSVLVGLALATSVVADEPSPVPNRFEASIGGFLGVSFHLKGNGGALVYTRFDPGRRNPQRSTVRPTTNEWRQFRKSLDALQIWTWRADYANPDVMDGTQWSVDLAFTDRRIKSAGSNSFPDAKGNPSKRPRTTPAFARYLEAVETLIGGKAFR
jgi:hypothetical protein